MKSKRIVKINHDYFSLSSKWQNLKYFIGQGHLLPHIADRLKWHCAPKFFMAPNFPTHIEIEASSACQMSCPMCKTTEMVKAGIDFFGLMGFDLYKKIIDECARESVYSVKLSWRGEPLLNPEIVKMITYAKSKKIKDVALLTNGERLNQKLSEGLVNAGLDWISISFDGFAEVYNRVRAPAVFEETIAKIKYMRDYRDKASARKPLIRVQSVHSAIKGRELEFLELWDGIADRVNFIADQKRSIRTNDYRHDAGYICPSPWQRMCISWDGRVAQCYSDYMMSNILGDVKSGSIKEVWRGEPFRKLRESMKSGRRLSTKPCRTCSDGGVIEEETVMVGDRAVKAAHYVHQNIDVRRIP